MSTLLQPRPVKYLTNNGLTYPNTFSNLCITPNCPNMTVYGPYNEKFAQWQSERFEKGLNLYIQHLQPQLNPYIEVVTSNMRPIDPNYMRYAKY